MVAIISEIGQDEIARGWVKMSYEEFERLGHKCPLCSREMLKRGAATWKCDNQEHPLVIVTHLEKWNRVKRSKRGVR